MKKLSITLILAFVTFATFASDSSVKPFESTIKAPPFFCTGRAYSIYVNANGVESDVSCAREGATCAEAQSAANRCKDLNVCGKVYENGGTPASALNCPEQDAPPE